MVKFHKLLKMLGSSRDKRGVIEGFHDRLDLLVREKENCYRSNYSHPLHRAVAMGEYDLVAEMLSCFSVNYRSQKNFSSMYSGDSGYKPGRTAIHLACALGDKNMVTFLLNYNPNLNLQDIERDTPLHIAIRRGRSDIVDLLLAHNPNVDIVNIHKKWPVDVAAFRPHITVDQFIGIARLSQNINRTDIYPRNPTLLHKMFETADERVAAKAVALMHLPGVDLHARDNRGKTPLHYVGINYMRWTLIGSALRVGMDPNAVDDAGTSAAAVLTNHADEKIVHMLLAAGADVGSVLGAATVSITPRVTREACQKRAKYHAEAISCLSNITAQQPVFESLVAACPTVYKVCTKGGEPVVYNNVMALNRDCAKRLFGTDRWQHIQRNARLAKHWEDGNYTAYVGELAKGFQIGIA